MSLKSTSTAPDIIRRKNLIVASLIGTAILAVVIGSLGGAVWLMLG